MMVMVKKVITGLIFFFSFLIFLPPGAEAVPAFARQTGFACNTCHYQHFPSLNEFGRSFKANGYTMVGGQSLVEGDFLSLPVVLNASLITKIRYQKTNGSDDLADKRNRGELQFPDEGALLLGGRVGEHIGFILEAQLVDPDGSAWASFKMPFVYDVGDTKLTAVPFTTDAGGASYGFELLNTGSMRMHRPLEHGGEISAQQYLGTGSEATGIAFAIYREIGYISFAFWSPEHGSTDARPLLRYGRIVLTPRVANWDLGFGVQVWDGETKFTTGDPPAFEKSAAEAWAADFQAQGAVRGLPLGVYFTYGVAGESSATVENLFNPSMVDERTAFAALTELGVLPGRLTLALGWRDADSGAAADSKEDATTAGATFLLTQNVQFQLNHTWYHSDMDPAWGDQLTTLMIFAAF